MKRWNCLAWLVLVPATAGSSAPAEPDSRTGTAAQPLAELPNVAVAYYEVPGADIDSINQAIRKRMARGAGAPVNTDWNLEVRLDKRTRGEACQINGSVVTFSAKAFLPRLADEAKASDEVRTAWRRYVAGLESDSVAQLWFVYNRIHELEAAFAGKTCDQGRADGERAIARLKDEFAVFAAQQRPQPLTLKPARWTKADKITCKIVTATGTRALSQRVCMSNRDWEKLGDSGEQATREMQDKPRVNAPF